jgi:hypothetical protein
VLRAIRGETKTRRDHLAVFREFLSHLDRIGKRSHRRTRSTKAMKPNGRRNGKG